MPPPSKPTTCIAMASGVNLEGKPFVAVTWGELRAQLTPEEARQHALHTLEAAEAAIHDAAVYRFLIERLNTGLENAANILHEIRGLRQDFAEQEASFSDE